MSELPEFLNEDYDEIDYLIDNDTIELGRRYRTLKRERDALQAMVEDCRELVPDIPDPVTRDELASIVGWPE